MIQIIIVVGIIWALLWVNSDNTVKDITSSLFYQLLGQIVSNTENYLRSTEKAINMSYIATQTGEIDTANKESVRKYLWPQINVDSGISLNYFGFTDGKFIG